MRSEKTMEKTMASTIFQLSKWFIILTVGICPVFLSTFSCLAASASAPDLGFIGANELSRTMQDWAILDARPKSDWQAGCIPGAHSFSWEDYTTTDKAGKRFCLRSPEELAVALSAMGIDENTPIAVYGDADKSWGGEGWACWVLSWLGHKGPIRLLAGGIQAWRDQKGPVGVEPEQPLSKTVHYQANLRQEVDIAASELDQKKDEIVLIDTRSTTEWLMGHLPKAVHIEWTYFYTGKDRHPLDAAAFKKVLEDHGVDMSRPIVYYCTGGVRSGYSWTIHSVSGLPPARNYSGGMEDWSHRPSH
jgi:thiosulfate/3-mercaptopyruvate sulfurtransferase